MTETHAIEALIGVALFRAVAAMSPGPNFLVVVHQSATSDGPAARRTVLGIVAATVMWGLAGFFGLTALFAAAPGLYLALKVIGGAYLIYLGLRLLITGSGAPLPAARR